MDVCDDHILNP